MTNNGQTSAERPTAKASRAERVAQALAALAVAQAEPLAGLPRPLADDGWQDDTDLD